MAFVRRKRGQVLLVHNEREPGSRRVRQRELHRFGSPTELEEVLRPSAWLKWTQAVAWRERAIEFDWPAVRERLEVALEAWMEEPSGATHRRHGKIERLASELVREVAHLSLAKTADAALVARVRPSLVALSASVERLLTPDRVHADAKEPLVISSPDSLTTADEAFDEGMELWWSGARREALKHFRLALQHDPGHADAHNHIGIVKLEARRWKDAERHFRAAVEGGQRALEREGDLIPWGFIENRPYLRALENLALVLREQRKWVEALAIQERLLEINPNDNQGVRWSIGFSYLRAGDSQSAIEAFEKTYREEAGCAFGLALSRLGALGASADIGEALLCGFAANRYVAPMLLGEPWTRLDAFHGTNLAEPEWADDVVASQADLWHAVPRGAELLRFWWRAAPVVTFRQKLDELMVQLGKLPVGAERSAVVREAFALRSDESLRELARAVRAAS